MAAAVNLNSHAPIVTEDTFKESVRSLLATATSKANSVAHTALRGMKNTLLLIGAALAGCNLAVAGVCALVCGLSFSVMTSAAPFCIFHPVITETVVNALKYAGMSLALGVPSGLVGLTILNVVRACDQEHLIF